MKQGSPQVPVCLTAALLVCAAAAMAGEPVDSAPVFSVHDLNRDGFVDRREYYGLRQRVRARLGPQRRAANLHAFETLDRNRDGRIDRDELLEGMRDRSAPDR